MIEKEKLEHLYFGETKSMKEIADLLDCSHNKVKYWMDKHGLKRRSISNAVYVKSNPNGDPFTKKKLQTNEEIFLYGLGLGLYWGEGTKSNTHVVRLGNTDPDLIKKFLEFLKTCFAIDESKLRFGLQIFSDMNPDQAQRFWMKKLQINRSQFYKVIVTPARSLGTYRRKTEHGVLTVYFANKKLRDFIVDKIEKL